MLGTGNQPLDGTLGLEGLSLDVNNNNNNNRMGNHSPGAMAGAGVGVDVMGSPLMGTNEINTNFFVSVAALTLNSPSGGDMTPGGTGDPPPPC